MYALIVAFVASGFLTWILWSYLVRLGPMDIPNLRSSHKIPVPRGGGLSIVLVFLVAIAWLVQERALDTGLARALGGGGIMIAGVGFLDDHVSLSVWLRLSVHFFAAGCALWWLRKLPILQLSHGGHFSGGLVQVLTLFGLVWLTNLYNFMDGIDGLAGMQAVIVCGLIGFLFLRSGMQGFAQTAWLLAAASGGFLIWNWAPARIFMGDVGSGFLGFVLGVLAISSSAVHPRLAWPWSILLAVFIVDSTVTLMWRVLNGKRWYQAHCSHAYQHAARELDSHWKVTLTVAAINLVWLFPLAWEAFVRPAAGPTLCFVAIAPLAYTAILCRAGRSDSLPIAMDGAQRLQAEGGARSPR
jgi:Fuc2NAc and GlcNAc transferase